MALTDDESELLDFALKALPPWMRADDEFLRGAAKLFGSVRTLTTYLLTQAKITTAEGATSTTPDWLMQHARDRDTVRLADESDTTLRIRLRTFANALTRESILGVANEILVANGITTPAQLIELPRDGIHLGSYTAPSGIGGAFMQAGTEQTFLPTNPPSFPPFQDATIFPPLTWKLVITGADEAANNGERVVIRLVDDAMVVTNGSGVADASDTGVSWTVRRYDVDDNLRDGFARTYLSRGYRIARAFPMLILILPYPTSVSVASSIETSVKSKIAAGFGLIVERRVIA